MSELHIASGIPTVSPPTAARFRGGRTLAWLLLVLVGATVVAWAGAQLARVRAPWLLFPLAMGCVIGGLTGGVALLLEWKHRPSLACGTIVAAAIVVIGMHLQEYWAALAAPRSGDLAMIRQAFPDVAARHGMAPPEGFGPFLNRMAERGRTLPWGMLASGNWAWLTWGLDAVLVGAAALGTTQILTARPYCDGCRTYYRTIRTERLPGERLRRLGVVLGRQFAPETSGDFRYLACRGGCGPGRVEVRFTDRRGPAPYGTWISANDRARLFQQLDQVS